MTAISGLPPKTLPATRSVAFPRSRRRASRAPPCRSSSGDDDRLFREQARRLDRLFYSSAPPLVEPDVAAPLERPAAEPIAAVLRDLPLWRVQWTVLPGFQEVLHVHVPHYSDMFNRLFNGQPRPWRFGHLYLPGGSANLGEEAYALAPGSQAPLIGTVMEVVQAVRFPDGRLLILAVGLGRFQVVEALQTVPHSRADVLLLPDAEELQAGEGLAMRSLESLPPAAPTAAVMQAAAAAAHQAAAASARAWWEYEVSASRVHERVGVIDGEDEATAMEFGRRLVAISSNEVVALPYAERPCSSAGAPDPDAVALQDAAFAADAATAAAAADLLGAAGQALASSGSEDDASGSRNDWRTVLANASAPGQSNLVADRGVTVSSAAEVLAEGHEPGSELPDCKERALLLEAAIWAEIDAVKQLAEKISGRPAPLLPGLLSLRPPPPAGAHTPHPAAAKEESAGLELAAHPCYPALRRVHRLSFALSSCLVDVSPSEGRQAVLEAGSATQRLRVGLAALRRHRGVLAAVAAVRDLKDDL